MGFHDLIAIELHRWRGSSGVFWGGFVILAADGGRALWCYVVACVSQCGCSRGGVLGCVVVVAKVLWFFASVAGCGVCLLLYLMSYLMSVSW